MPINAFTSDVRYNPDVARDKLRRAWIQAGGVAVKAAQILGISPRSWYTYIDILGLGRELSGQGRGPRRRKDADQVVDDYVHRAHMKDNGAE